MTEPGTPEPVQPDQPADSTGPARGRGRLLAILLVVLLVVAGAGVGGFLLLKDDEDPGPTYPKKWDARVLPYVKIAEKERGLTFKHPVAVRFLSAGAFEKTVRSDESDLDKDDKIELERFTGLMRAVGLIGGGVDLFKAFNDAHGSGTLAYYSFDDQRVTIKGKTLTPASKSTLVHELTHALQDQHFDVGDRTRKLDELVEDHKSTNTESSVFEAIVEGDASRVETLYADSLSAADKKALDASQKDESDDAGDKLKDVPEVVLTLIGAPYTLGEAMLTAVSQKDGNDAVDDLFDDVPKHESSLLDPFEILTDDTDADKIGKPDLEKGEKEFDAGEFGVLTMYFMLAERIGLRDALDAVDGWNGDQYVAYEQDGTTCVRMTVAGDTDTDTARLTKAFQSWIAAVPGTPATVSESAGTIAFRSCDPGKSATGGKDASSDALELATVRTYLSLGIVRSGAPAEFARCTGGKLVNNFELADLVDPEFGAKDPAVLKRIQTLAAGCR